MKLLPLLLLAVSPLCAFGAVVLQDNNDAANGPVQTQEGWSWESCGMHKSFSFLSKYVFLTSSISCSGQDTDPLQIESIEVSPDPPKPGQNMTVTVNAIAQERIEVRVL